jgi:hypothetical protein
METEVAGEILGRVVHHYSHFTLDATVVLSDERLAEVEMYTLCEIKVLPLSRADRKVVALLEQTTLST